MNTRSWLERYKRGVIILTSFCIIAVLSVIYFSKKSLSLSTELYKTVAAFNSVDIKKKEEKERLNKLLKKEQEILFDIEEKIRHLSYLLQKHIEVNGVDCCRDHLFRYLVEETRQNLQLRAKTYRTEILKIHSKLDCPAAHSCTALSDNFKTQASEQGRQWAEQTVKEIIQQESRIIASLEFEVGMSLSTLKSDLARKVQVLTDKQHKIQKWGSREYYLAEHPIYKTSQTLELYNLRNKLRSYTENLKMEMAAIGCYSPCYFVPLVPRDELERDTKKWLEKLVESWNKKDLNVGLAE
jgi:hypothetical protein